jgi:hypothetical protein
VRIGASETHANSNDAQEGTGMLDVIFIGLVLGFFALAIWYVRFCERV